MSVIHMPVQEVVADVGHRSLHPFHEDVSLGQVEVVGKELSRLTATLPFKLAGYVVPEPLGVFDRLFVDLLVPFERW